MKSKKFLKILAIITSIILIGIILYLLFNFKKKKQKIDMLKNIPTFSIKDTNGNIITNNNLDNTRVKTFVYFSPSCHFCQAEAEELSENYNISRNVQWIWIASEPLDEIKKFAQKYKLDNNRNIHWCHDEKAAFYQQLPMNSVPYFLVYDKNNHLIKRSSGAIKLEKLINTEDENK